MEFACCQEGIPLLERVEISSSQWGSWILASIVVALRIELDGCIGCGCLSTIARCVQCDRLGKKDGGTEGIATGKANEAPSAALAFCCPFVFYGTYRIP